MWAWTIARRRRSGRRRGDRHRDGDGWRGGGGKTVSIRHASGYVSSYLHLSSIAAGIRPGVHVAPGQTVGRVGATGLASGPHLDYGHPKNGRFVTPLIEHRRMPPGEPIPGAHLDEFAAVRDLVLARLDATGPEIGLSPPGTRRTESGVVVTGSSAARPS